MKDLEKNHSGTLEIGWDCISSFVTHIRSRGFITPNDSRHVRPPTASQESAKGEQQQEGPETQEDLEDSKANEKGGEGPFSRALGGAPPTRRVRLGL